MAYQMQSLKFAFVAFRTHSTPIKECALCLIVFVLSSLKSLFRNSETGEMSSSKSTKNRSKSEPKQDIVAQ